jgi:hypothetical protein
VLRTLPAQRFVWGNWNNADVNIDYRVGVEHHNYSVPHTLVHERVDVRFAASTVEIFYGSQRVRTVVPQLSPVRASPKQAGGKGDWMNRSGRSRRGSLDGVDRASWSRRFL